jgi:hypothetical protein
MYEQKIEERPKTDPMVEVMVETALVQIDSFRPDYADEVEVEEVKSPNANATRAVPSVPTATGRNLRVSERESAGANQRADRGTDSGATVSPKSSGRERVEVAAPGQLGVDQTPVGRDVPVVGAGQSAPRDENENVTRAAASNSFAKGDPALNDSDHGRFGFLIPQSRQRQVSPDIKYKIVEPFSLQPGIPKSFDIEPVVTLPNESRYRKNSFPFVIRAIVKVEAEHAKHPMFTPEKERGELPQKNARLTSAHHCDTLISRGLQWRITLGIPRRRRRVTRVRSQNPSHSETLTEWLSGLLRRPLENPLQNRSKNQIPLIPPVVPETVLVQVGLQIFPAHGVVHTADPALYQTPKSFNSLSVKTTPKTNKANDFMPHSISPD